jgi:hypothetical protein
MFRWLAQLGGSLGCGLRELSHRLDLLARECNHLTQVRTREEKLRARLRLGNPGQVFHVGCHTGTFPTRKY